MKNLKVGDFVIHIADAKKQEYLMRVVKIKKSGLVGTVYHYRTDLKDRQSSDGIWWNYPFSLLSTSGFGIETPKDEKC